MFLTIPDIIIILIIFGFAMYGLIMGLIEAVGSMVGLFLGVTLGSMYFRPFGEWLSPFIFSSQRTAYIVAFIIIYIIVSKAIGIVFLILEKFFHIIAIIPFLKTINRIAGAIFGLAEGLIFSSLVLYIANGLFTTGVIHEAISGSKVAGILLGFAGIILRVLPTVFKNFTISAEETAEILNNLCPVVKI